MQLLAMLIACSAPDGAPPAVTTGDTGQPPVPVSYVDEGDLCIVQVDGELLVTVVAPDCYGGCASGLEGACSGVVEGQVITLTSEISWMENDGSCADACYKATATCSFSGLADGTWTVVLGGNSETIQLPLTTPCEPEYTYY